ncbi:potassium-transporting ATPase subunit KdpB [Dietzia sp. JS16-p6b]|uniref:potassium-transporting ATPase subunit KdpB n=1 Tax=unclassified Dietzia TaxID=2617939 RepID=UPI001316BAE2|nr:potassium-transporting ATPase subunit B [Dietzia sp. DQ12-45-1b]
MTALLDSRHLAAAAPGALRKLDPRHQARNPVLFVVWVGSLLTTVLAVLHPTVFSWSTAAWLWATVLFAGMAESVAEGRGKAQADSLRKVTTETTARVRRGPHETQTVPSTELAVGDLVEVLAGETIPGDGDVVEGIATVDESAITGESAPVVRESGGDRSAVTGGTVVLSDRIVVRISTAPGESFVDRMIALVEGAERTKTPNEIALNILLAMLTIVFLVAVLALGPVAAYSGAEIDPIRLIALLVCLIPTTIGALLSAIGIAGMDRLVQHNVLATSGRAVEAAGDIDTLLLDKTGTITFGARQATSLDPAAGASTAELAEAARASSLADETPEGRSIVEFCAREHDLPAAATRAEADAEAVEFTAQTRMSGIDLPAADGTVRQIRKGASDTILAWVAAHGGRAPEGVRESVERIARRGATPLVVAELTVRANGAGDATKTGDDEAGELILASAPRILGAIELSDVVKPGMRERFAELRAMGIRTVMITGDNPLTAAAIAAEAGVDDYLAEATPDDKLARIRAEQTGGRLVAMTGDGTNDAPALAQADVGVAMNSGTTAAKEAGNMVDLDSDPTKLIDIVGIGKQLLITRGALTTFSLANDLAKYFAILPALFVGIFPQLDRLNVMGLASPESAILSAVIFNAIVIVLLVPLALRGVRYRAASAASLLRRNLLIYGVGGVIAPFLGIWLIDLLVRHLPGIA